jgi:molecular chaperone DnaJ
MAKRDFYDVLGVARSASAEDIKKAFRKQAMQYHPDRNSGDKNAEQKFKEINEAYDVLKDDQKRAAYDQFGHAAFEHGGSPRGGPGGFEFAGGFADIFDEMFGDIMGGRGRRQAGPSRGADTRFNLEIGLDEAFRGNEVQIRVPTLAACDVCKGTGAAEGSKPVNCATCRGVGKVRAQQGFFTIERTCPNCHGAGRIIEKPCKTCSGSGRTHRDKTLSVSIPKGVEDGTRIRLAGEGEAGLQGAPAGDLYIFLSVKPHPVFQRDGAHLYCRVPIPMTRAALGGVIEVPTLDGGRARLTVPQGAQSGHRLRLRGKGMPVLRSPLVVDMIVELQVETPVNLTKRQQEILEEFEHSQGRGGKSTSPESEGFFAKVKELWEDLKE